MDEFYKRISNFLLNYMIVNAGLKEQNIIKPEHIKTCIGFLVNSLGFTPREVQKLAVEEQGVIIPCHYFE